MRASARFLMMAMILVALSGCATEFEKRLEEAQRVRMMAADAGAEWLRTEELIKQAQTEAARGDMESANSFLELAQFQAETAIKQAQHESEAWSSRVVR